LSPQNSKLLLLLLPGGAAAWPAASSGGCCGRVQVKVKLGDRRTWRQAATSSACCSSGSGKRLAAWSAVSNAA
jgi:hypothetical protein